MRRPPALPSGSARPLGEILWTGEAVAAGSVPAVDKHAEEVPHPEGGQERDHGHLLHAASDGLIAATVSVIAAPVDLVGV